jgi:DNA polymerase-4
MSESRVILHVDMDAFFASVEQRDDPDLRGRPVLVGGAGARGVVAAASYEARAFGCRSAMPMAVARRLCPQAAIVPPRGRQYRAASQEVFTILRGHTPLVQGLSIDEAFLDVSGSAGDVGAGRALADRIKAQIRERTDLTASVGVAANKFLAKLASDLQKPDGLVVIRPEDAAGMLEPMPIGRMWGVGPATEARLGELGVRRFGDVRRLPVSMLERRFGVWGRRLLDLSWGRDDRPVVTESAARSVSQEQTFGTDRTSPDEVRRVLARQAEEVSRRLRSGGLRARTVTVKIRYGDFQTITRSATLPDATDRTDRIADAARTLFDRWADAAFRPVRLIGVGTSHLTGDAEQLELFTSDRDERQRRLDRVTDEIRGRLGRDAVHRGP